MSLLGKENEDWFAAGQRAAKGIRRRFENEKNLKIAKAIGGEFIKGEDVGEYDHWRFPNPNVHGTDGQPPDFVNSLAQMHEAEKWLLEQGDPWHMYCDALLDIIVRQGGYQAAELLVHASARQRADAFIAVIETPAPESAKL